MADDQTYGLTLRSGQIETPAPAIDYLPSNTSYPARIGLIGCGGITTHHLTAYKAAGYEVVALCDVDIKRAEAQRDKFYPNAKAFASHKQVLDMGEVNVVDVATHPEERYGIIKDAIAAGKHILSQKPFVTEIGKGKELAKLAREKGVKLAINQNGRWAPHFRYARQLIRGGYIGDVNAVNLSVVWNHTWVAGTAFEDIRFLILYDFGIHWFDILNTFMNGEKPLRIYASNTKSIDQAIRPPLLAQALVEYEHAQAAISFVADSRFGLEDRTVISGTRGMIVSEGPELNEQQLRFITGDKVCYPKLSGHWFPDGFHGTMAELLSAIEEDREPEHNPESVLASLEMCFAALQSADSHKPVVPGEARVLLA